MRLIEGKQFRSVGPQGSDDVPGSIVSPGANGVERAAAKADCAKKSPETRTTTDIETVNLPKTAKREEIFLVIFI
jgi:hypothetical protein